MTMLRYPMGCAAGSPAHTLAWGIGCNSKVRPASSPYLGNSNNAWNVNNNQVRLVRASLWSVACKP